MSERFEITYHNDDGYAGGDRPYHTQIGENDLSGDESEDELIQLFWDTIETEFENTHRHLYSGQESEFVEWALSANKRAQEEDQ